MDRVNSVAELLEKAQERGMPLEKMRFFINQDMKEPRCFGIYQEPDTGHWIVYKNKADGSRAVRYAGPDEAFAAQELWAKINDEIEKRRPTVKKKKSRERVVLDVIIGLVAAALLFFGIRAMLREPKRGYYLIDDVLYYFQDTAWYYYADDGWGYYDAPDGYEWYQGGYYGSTYDGFDDPSDAFEDSDYYVEPSSDSDDSDIFDSWDVGDTDWDSDW